MSLVKMSDDKKAIGKNAIGKKCHMVKMSVVNMSDSKNAIW